MMEENEWVVIKPGDDDCMADIKDKIRNLPLAERKIFLMYMEEGTYSGVAKILRCSVPTVSKKIRVIEAKLKEKTEKTCMEY